MKRFRVIKDLRGLTCIQSRHPIIFFLWNTIAYSADAARMKAICDDCNAP